MKLTRRFQLKMRYAYCRADGCEWTSIGDENPYPDARAHVNETGHEARVVTTSETILRPEKATAHA